MELKIETVDEFIVLGVPAERDGQVNSILWAYPYVKNPDHTYYVYDTGSTICGKMVSNASVPPDGCQFITIPKGTYAVYHEDDSQHIRDMLAKTHYKVSRQFHYWLTFVQNHTMQTFIYMPVDYSEDLVNITKLPHLPQKESTSVRDAYIRAFFDTDSEDYRKHHFQLYWNQGVGYLWGFLKSPFTSVHLEDVKQFLQQKEKVLFFWDSPSHIGTEVSRKYVYQMQPQNLLNHYERFTDDLYIFDETLTWTAVISHESNADGFRCRIVESP
ncbi:hypothetical protein ACTID9_02105 [Brevibacillus fluminis]|uniref:hypothetical protein n=1 Tax=Brevibacillus fluminis TaxID=511487 RepID=UPI003F8959FC